MSDIQDRLERLSPEKRALLEGLKRHSGTASHAEEEAPGRIEPVSPGRHPVMSFSQERFWFLNELDPYSAAYNVVLPVGFRGRLDVSALERALNGIIQRHQALRSHFRSRDGKPVLEIADRVQLQMPLVEMPGLDDAARTEAIDAAFRDQCRQPFDLANGPLLRARMLRFGDELHVLLLAIHHIVTDEWSFRVLFRELSELYRADIEGVAPDLEPLRIQYADYAAWQRERLKGDALERQLVYWRDRLEGVESLKLPLDRPRPAQQTFHAGQVRRELPRELSDAVRLFARNHRASLFMTLLCGFTALLSRYGSQRDVVVASAAANRESEDVEGLIGFFVNTLALRTDVSDNPPLETLLERVKENTIGAYSHHSLPFEKVVDALGIVRDASRNPIAQVAFTLQNRAIDALDFEGLEVFAMKVPQAFTRFDIELFVRDDANGFAVQIVFNRDLFSVKTMERMLAHYEQVLEALVTHPQQHLGDVELVVGDERRQIVEQWNDTATDYPREASIVELFEEQAARRGDAIALQQGRELLTYQALDRRANQVARRLLDIGIQAQEPVGLCFERSLGMIVAILGILKAGGVYVPLDPDYPLERLATMLEDAGAGVLLRAPGLVAGLSDRVRAVVELDGAESLAASDEPVSGPTPAADDLAYVMYTSGSTGSPKGVCVEHRSVVRLVRDTNYLEFSADEVFLQLAPISFDAATLEIWGSLLNGARLVLAPAGPPSLAELAALLEENRVSVLWLTAAMFRLMVDEQLDALHGVRQVLAGGEALSVPHVNRYLSDLPEGSRLVNGYGPTENTTFTCCHVMVSGMRVEATVPIGQPISNTRVYVLDAHGHPVPVGVVGELYAAGDGLARGYWRRDLLTEQSFVRNRLAEEPGERLYRTGDLVRWRHDGVLEFVGRRDHQVKVRGHRIELGEVETALASQPEVREAVVLCREDIPGDKRLVGYVVLEPTAEIGVDALRTRLKDSLPVYMVPSLVMELSALPLTPVGKLDRAALPAPCEAAATDTSAPALGALESRLAAIWCEVLACAAVDREEDFFAIGGHSLLATQVVSRIHKELGVTVSLRDMFANTSVSSMATLLRQKGAGDGGGTNLAGPPITPAAHSGGLPLSYAQERLWFLWRVSPRSDAYNVPLMIRLTGELDTTALGAAFDELVARHASLRTRFALRDDEPVQIIQAAASRVLTQADLSYVPGDQRETTLAKRLEVLRSGAFDLERGPMLRAELIRLEHDDHVLAVVMHHIVTDGWSLGVMFRELSALYRAFRLGAPSPLSPLPIQYADYAVWQRQWLKGETLEMQVRYWQEQLDGAAVLELPTTFSRPEMQSFAGARVRVALGPSLLRDATALAQREGTTLFMTLLAGFVMLLEHYSRQDDIVVGSPIANRTRVELEGLVGFFVNTLVMRIDASGEPSFRELLARVRDTAIGAYAHQDVPFEKLVESLHVVRDMSRNPLFQVMFQLQEAPGDELDMDGLTLGQVPAGSDTTRFDLECHAWQTDDDVSLTFIYNVALFDEGTVARMLDHYRALLASCISNPQVRTSEIDFLGDEERARLLDCSAGAVHTHAGDVVSLVEAMARRYPDAQALSFGEDTLTYGELDRAANRLAHRLLQLGAGRETPVGVLLDRSVYLVAAWLAVLKAGAAYLPMDPGYPTARLQHMLSDSGAPVLISEDGFSELIAGFQGNVLKLDATEALTSYGDDRSPDIRLQPDQLAYLIYTSGSTGVPKGVAVEHRALANLVGWHNRVYEVRKSDRATQLAALSFDASVWEVWPYLAAGASVHMVDEHTRQSPTALWKWLVDKGITLSFVPTPLAEAMLREPIPETHSLRAMLTGGDRLHGGDLPARLSFRLINHYGPTENAVVSTCGEVDLATAKESAPSIGWPIDNIQAYVLDERMGLQADGVPGELYVGGCSLARGYWRRQALTEERFVANPFTEGERLYRTGDRVRRRVDGSIEFLGRVDEQVKVRGFRIELGEIEHALASHDGVREAVVISREDTPGDPRLVAYVVGNTSLEALTAHLKKRLPSYMVPSAFVVLDELPLTSNGKVDRKALPLPEGGRQLEQAYVAPSSDTEQCLATIWRDVLGIEQVGVYDNFFDLGGHSLLLMRVHAMLERALGRTVPVVLMFRYPSIAALASHLEDEPAEVSILASARARVARARDRADRGAAVAIIGMAGRFPGAPDVETFWRNLAAGEEAIRLYSPEELRAAGVAEEQLANPAYVPARGALDDVDLFDAAYFNYPPREAEMLDPQQRLFLECAHEALDSAGYDPKRFAGLIGVYAGSAASTYLFNLMSRPDRLVGGSLPMQLGNDKDFLATRASYKLDLRGPSINVQTACSTSLVAVHEACRALIEGECDMALAGGVNATAVRVGGYTYVEQGILSPDGHCRAFDADARGTVPGEGVGVIVLKRLEDALHDRDVIHAVVRGTAINNDGDQKIGFTAPSVRRQAEVIALAQAVAGVEPGSISYIEAHGTGTSLGDPIEVEALNLVFADGDREPCAMGSVKSNIGHLDAAAGIAGLIKTVLALKHAELPPSLHFKHPNPAIRFDDGPFKVSTRLEPWLAAPGAPRRAGVNSFGIGGTNAHIVLEEAPACKPSGDARQLALLALSARTAGGLETASQRLAAHLERHPALPLADVSYTLRVGRREHEHRRVVVCGDHDSAIAALRGRDRSRSWTARANSKQPAVVFMFPGQGTQYPGMGRELYDTEPVYRHAVDRCAEHLAPLIGCDLRTLLFPSPGLESQCAGELGRTSLTQPALFVTGYALARLLLARGVEPDAMLGHSIGELTAACVSGALTLEDALTLVAERGRLMEDTPEGAMLAVGIDEQALGEHIGSGLSIAAINAPRACVVSGMPEDVAVLEQRLAAVDIPCQRLHTRRAFHSELMDSVLDRLTAAAGRLRALPPRIRYLSNVTGDWIGPEMLADPAYWSRQVRSPVRFSDAIAAVLDEFPSCVLLEVGPGGVLSSLVRQQVAADAEVDAIACLPHAQQPYGADQALLSAIGRAWQRGARIDWSRFDAGESRARVELPAYPFERKRFWVERKAKSETARVETAPVTPARKPDIGDWFQVPSWQRGVARSAPTGTARNWLLFADAHGVADALATRLTGEGHRVSIARCGNVFAEEEDGAAFTLRVAEAVHYRVLFDVLEAGGKMPDEIVHLWSLGLPRQDGAQNLVDACFHSPLLIAQALGDRAGSRSVRMLLITDAMQRVLGDESVVAEKSLLAGPVRVIGKEFPNIATAGVDLQIGPEPEGVTSAVEALLSELSFPAEGRLVAYRNAIRWTQTLLPNRIEAPTADAGLPRPGSVVLITGGLGGVGLALAERCARSPGARLVLVQRSALPALDQWDSWLSSHDGQDRITRRIKAVRALERLGAEVMVASADIADAVQVGPLISAVRARFGRIDGVIHAAGIAGSGLAQLKDRETAAAVLRPKVIGARVLIDALSDAPPEFMVLCSSLYALTGGVGQIDYTAANAFLDALALELDGTGSQVVSIAWDAWRDVGMVVDMQREDGLAKAREESLALGISAEEGREVLARALSVRMPQLAVSPRDSRPRQAAVPASTGDGEMTATPAPVAKRRDTSSWIYAPSWQRSPLPATERESPDGQRWLVFGDDLGVSDGLIGSLVARQADVIRVAAGSEYRREHDGAYVLRPGQPGDFDTLLRELRASNWWPDVVVHLWGITGRSDAVFGDGQFEAAYHSLLNLLGAIARDSANAPMRFSVVADQVQDVSHADEVCPAKSASIGLLRCAPLEMPALQTRHIDIEISDDWQSRRAAALLYDELCSSGSETVVAHRGGYRWVQSFTALPGLASQETPLKERGVYVITGGLGRIGLALARFLADTRDARLVLVSRAGLPPRDQWVSGNADLDTRTRARIAAVQSVEAAGGEMIVVAADVARPGVFADVLDQAETRFGAVDGVFHCAADLSPRSFATLDALDREKGAGQFEAKVRGAVEIVEAIDDRPGIGFCVLMSSVSTVLGGIGFGAYAAANAVVEAIAARCATNDTDRRYTAIAWDGWQFDPKDAAAAPLAMSAGEGMQALTCALVALDLPRLVVSTADLHARILEIAGRIARADNAAEAVERDAYERPELDQEYVAPRDATEDRIAAIWAELLGIDRVGVHDDFLALGGHSLLATQMLSRLRSELGAELTLAMVFEAPTVAELARRIAPGEPGTAAAAGSDALDLEIQGLSESERQSLLAAARRETRGMGD